MGCYNCRRIQTDPSKGSGGPWLRLVIDGSQVLLCPQCAKEDPGPLDLAERCARCASTRLSIMLGSIVCRECGAEREAKPDRDGAPPLSSG